MHTIFINDLKMHTIFINDLIKLSWTCFEQPSVHPQEDLYMQFFWYFFMHPYKKSGQS